MSSEIERAKKIQLLHSVLDEQLKSFVQAIESKQQRNFVVLDLFSGNGVAGIEAIKEILKKNPHSEVKASFIDKYSELLEEVSKNTKKLPLKFQADLVQKDLIDGSIPLRDSSIDIVTIKMGLHEVPFETQVILIKDIFRVLKKGGQLLIWENNILKEGSRDLLGFNNIIQVKDKLAGYESMSKYRYFTSNLELTGMLSNAGFQNLVFVSKWERTWDSYFRFQQELDNNYSSLAKLNEVIDENITGDLRESAGYTITSSGHGRRFIIPSAIISVTK